MGKTHVLFIVDQSAGSDVSKFAKIIKKSVEDRADICYDVYTYAAKGRLRVDRNVGNLNIRPLKKSEVLTYLNASEAIDELGERLSETPEKDKPDNILVVLLSDQSDSNDKFDEIEEFKSRMTTQTYVYGWRFLFGGATRWDIGDTLGISDSLLVRTDDVDASAEVLRRLFDDLRNYGDCGTFAEDR